MVGLPTRALTTRGTRPDIPFAGWTGRADLPPRPPSDGRDFRVNLAFALLASIFGISIEPSPRSVAVVSWLLRDIRTSLVKYSGFDRCTSRRLRCL